MGVGAEHQVIHLKRVDDEDPSIRYVDESGHLHLYLSIEGVASFAEALKCSGLTLINDVHETDWQTREVVIQDDRGIRCIQASRCNRAFKA